MTSNRTDVARANTQAATEDFAAQYEVILVQQSADTGFNFTSYAEMKAAVKNFMEVDGYEEGCDQMLAYESFDEFFDAFDVVTGYEQMDVEDYASSYKLLLEVVYSALVAEYKVYVESQSHWKDTPEDTMCLVERLKAMHPEMIWGTTELGDYEQYSTPDAPEVIIYFTKFLGSERIEIPDAYSDVYGSATYPSSWGVSDEAAKLLRDHNHIDVSMNWSSIPF